MGGSVICGGGGGRRMGGSVVCGGRMGSSVVCGGVWVIVLFVGKGGGEDGW